MNVFVMVTFTDGLLFGFGFLVAVAIVVLAIALIWLILEALLSRAKFRDRLKRKHIDARIKVAKADENYEELAWLRDLVEGHDGELSDETEDLVGDYYDLVFVKPKTEDEFRMYLFGPKKYELVPKDDGTVMPWDSILNQKREDEESGEGEEGKE